MHRKGLKIIRSSHTMVNVELYVSRIRAMNTDSDCVKIYVPVENDEDVEESPNADPIHVNPGAPISSPSCRSFFNASLESNL